MAWGQSAWDLFHLQTHQKQVQSGKFVFPGNDEKFHVQTLKNQHTVTELPCPSPHWKTNLKILLLWQTDWFLEAIQILNTPPLWAENQKISRKSQSILIWIFLRYHIIASIPVKSSWASQKVIVSHSAPQSLSFLGGWDSAVYSHSPPPWQEMQGNHSTWHITRTGEMEQRSYSYIRHSGSIRTPGS